MGFKFWEAKWDRTYTEDYSTFRQFLCRLPPFVKVDCAVHAQLHRRDVLVLLQLRSDLCGYGFGPRVQGEVHVIAEYTGKRLGLDQRFVEVPHEAISYSMRLCFEFDANGDKGGSF